MLILWICVFLVSLFALVKSADYFTDTAEKVGKFFGLSNILIGVLIIAIGTSAPELVTSIFGVFQNEGGILSGNVMGSVIANIFLGLGLAVVVSFKTAKFNWSSVSNDVTFLLSGGILLALTVYDGVFKFYEALIFLLVYIIYIFYSLNSRKKSKKEVKEDFSREVSSKLREDFEAEKIGNIKKPKNIGKLIGKLLISLGVLIFAAKFTVDSLIEIANLIGWGTSVLAASVVAIGTSLPEISVAISSIKKDNFDLVVGNIIGSNVFNIFAVFGLVGLFTDIPVPDEVIYLILPVMVGAVFIQWLVSVDKKITVSEGLLMLILYITFTVRLFGLI